MIANSDSLLSVHAAAQWLNRHGVRRTRHAVYMAIVRGEMPVAATSQRMMFVRESDVEKYAAELRKEEPTG